MRPLPGVYSDKQELLLSEENFNKLFVGNGHLFTEDLINYLAYFDKNDVINLIIPDSVEEIASFDNYGIVKCTIDNLFIPRTVELIGVDAFSNIKINNLTFESNRKEWCTVYSAFVQSELKEINLVGKLTLKGNAFFGADVTKVEIPNECKTENIPFAHCKKLKTVIINDSEVCERAFSNCINLSNIILGENVKIIRNYAFVGCTGLLNIDFNKVKEIGIFAFAGSGLLNADLSNVQSTGAFVFSTNNAMDEIILPSDISLNEATLGGCIVDKIIVPNPDLWNPSFFEGVKFNKILSPKSLRDTPLEEFEDKSQLLTLDYLLESGKSMTESNNILKNINSNLEI